MSGRNGGLNIMEVSKSSHSDTRMAVEGSSLNTLMGFTAEEKIEAKEWVSNPGIGSVQQDESCQDDMFSLDELSAVEYQPEQQVVLETAICTETTESGEHGTNHADNVVDLHIDARNTTDIGTYGGEYDEKIENPSNISPEDKDATEHGIKKIKEAPNMSTEARGAFDIVTGDKDQKESVQLNQFILNAYAVCTAQEDQPHLNQPETELESTGNKDQKKSGQLKQNILDNSQNVENVSTTNAVSTMQEDQPHLNQPEIEATSMTEEEGVSHQKDPGSEALQGMQDCQKQPEMKATSDINTGDKYQKELVQVNQVALDNSQHVNNVSTTLEVSRVVESQPHLHQPEKEQTELLLENKQPDRAVMKEEEENFHQRQPGLETLNEKNEDTHQKQPELEAMKEENGSCQCLEEMPNTAQAVGGVDDKSEANDNKVSVESNPDFPQGGIVECNAEPMEHRDVEESENMQKEFESLKGRKVSKRFKKKKFLGEVIGYDPESRWFKVLYEDGDEEELEKEELDCILLPVGDAKASVSRKRKLRTGDDEHKKPNGSAKKSRKMDIDGTPGKSRKIHIAEDQTPLSQQVSEAKKRKSTVASGKSKSSKTSTPKAQTRIKKGLSTTKSIEKKGSANSSHTKSKNKPKSQKKQSVGKIIQDSAKQNSSVTKSLKFDSANKKTPMKMKKSSQDSPRKEKITRSGRTVRTPNKSLKVRSVATDAADDKVEVQKISTAEKSEVHKPSRKRKLGSDIQGGLSTVDNRRGKKTKPVNDLKTPLGSSVKSRNIVEDAKLQISHEKSNDAEYQVPLNEEKVESSAQKSTGKRPRKNYRGNDYIGDEYIGRKVKKDFGGQLFGGVVTRYTFLYEVKYEDGDSEELTFAELQPILLSEEGSPQNKTEEKQSVESKSKQKKGSKRI